MGPFRVLRENEFSKRAIHASRKTHLRRPSVDVFLFYMFSPLNVTYGGANHLLMADLKGLEGIDQEYLASEDSQAEASTSCFRLREAMLVFTKLMNIQKHLDDRPL